MVNVRKVSLVGAALALVAIVALPAAGQEEMAVPPGADAVVEASSASMGPGEMYHPEWLATFPEPTPEQLAIQKWVESRPHGAPPITNVPRSVAAADPETQSLVGAPLQGNPALASPGDPVIFRKKGFGGAIPSGYRSNVMESSIAISGRVGFYTGNWFAARTSSGGTFFNYVDPYADYADFCCDQVSLYDPGRHAFFWLRMGVPADNAGNYQNTFKLGVSTDGAKNFCTYATSPIQVNGTWTDQWWDYPHLSVGADYLYMAWNMFNQGGSWTRTVILRWPLDALTDCAGFGYNYFDRTDVFTLVPIHGAYNRVYFGSNWLEPQDWTKFKVFWWDEDTTAVAAATLTIPAWTPSDNMSCGSGGNWLGRAGPRVLAGARYTVNDGDPAQVFKTGNKVLGWWWNAAPDGAHPKPYIDGVAFWEETRVILPGLQGRPFLWNSGQCFAYPSAAANERGDVGLVFHYGEGVNETPSVAFAIADDYVPPPPGWTFYTVHKSRATPSDNSWGDYNTVRTGRPSPLVWSASSHFIAGVTPCASGNCSTPLYFVFGRERDRMSWSRYQLK